MYASYNLKSFTQQTQLTGVRRTPVAVLRHNQTCEAPPTLFRAGLAPRREGEETRNLQAEEEEQRLMEKNEMRKGCKK